MLKVGAIGFGGGSALIPVMEKELVEDKQVLDERTFTGHTIIANITPGALPVKLGALAGYHQGGPWWSLSSALAVALPGTVLTLGLLAAFSAMGVSAIQYIEHASVGISAFIIVLLIGYITKVMRAGGQRRRSYVIIVLLAYLATGANQTVTLVGHLVGGAASVNLPALNAVGLVSVSLVIIGLYSLVRPNRRVRTVPAHDSASDGGAMRAVVLFAVVGILTFAVAAIIAGRPAMQLLDLIALSTITSFGGGEAYVGVAAGFFVTGGFLTAQTFYGQLVPLTNALPGPILIKLATGVGYAYGLAESGPMMGWVMAIAAFIISTCTCCAVAAAVLGGYDRARRSAIIQNLSNYILPVICGLLITTSISMVLASVSIGGSSGIPAAPMAWALVTATALMWWVHRRVGLPDLPVLVAGGAASLLLMSL
jgi:chromate transporter